MYAAGDDDALDAESQDGENEPARLRNELAAQRQANLRLRADLANLQRRASQARESAAQSGRGAAVLALLPALDALDLALAAGSVDTEFYNGVASTRRVFLSALASFGALPIETALRPFDPHLHEAVSTVMHDDVAPGTIVDQVRRGFMLGTDVLRPAQVIVSTQANDRDDAVNQGARS